MPSTSSSSEQLINLQSAQLAAQVANWAAQLEFAKQRFQLLELPQFQHASQMDIDRLAFEKATQAWQQAFQEASVTGTYQGQPTMQWLTTQAQLTGVLNGNQTLQGKLTDAQVAQMNSAMKIAQDDQLLRQQQFGFQQTQWNAEFALQQAAQKMQYTGYTDTGDPTLQREAQNATITGYDIAGNPTLARQAQEASQAQAYLSLLSSLRGPQNAFAQARVIGNTPGSMRDIANAWLGKYNIGGTTGSGLNPPPATPAGLMGEAGTAANPAGLTVGGYTFPTANAMPAMPAQPALVIPAGQPSTYQEAPVPVWPTPSPGSPYQPPTTPAVPGAYVPGSDGPIPGRGFDSSTWNDATRQAVAVWNAAHPGYYADGSQVGYTTTPPAGTTTPREGVIQPTPSVSFPEPPQYGAEPIAAPTPTGAEPVTTTPPQGVVTPMPAAPHTPDTAAATVGTAAALTPATTAQGGTYTYTGAQTPAPATGTTSPVSGAGETAYAAQAPIISPPGTQAPLSMYNYTPTPTGQVQVHAPGAAADSSMYQLSTPTPASQDDLSSWMKDVLPNQINAKNYGNMNEYTQALGWAGLEDQGWDIGAAQDAFKKSLPRYGGPSLGSFA